MAVSTWVLDALGRMRCGAALLDSDGTILAQNDTAARLLGTPATAEAGSGFGRWESIIQRLKVGTARPSEGEESSVIVSRPDGRPLIIHVVPGGQGETLVLTIDLDESNAVTTGALQRIFNLTGTEAIVAVSISNGLSLGAIARKRNISIWTVRSHLTAIFAKTRTRRQVELVALVTRIALLP